MKFKLIEGRNVIELTAETTDQWKGTAIGMEVIDHPSAGRCLDCGLVKVGRKMQKMCVRLDDKPELSDLVDQMLSIRAAKQAAKEAAEKKHREDIDSSAKPIVVNYHDGEYLSGYQVWGYEAEKLVALGVAKEVNMWGTHVDDDLVKALGESFTLANAEAFARPKLEDAAKAKAGREEKRKAHVEKCIETARQTGEKVRVDSWMEDCNDPHEECSLDSVTRWIDADGNETLTRFHTW